MDRRDHFHYVKQKLKVFAKFFFFFLQKREWVFYTTQQWNEIEYDH